MNEINIIEAIEPDEAGRYQLDRQLKATLLQALKNGFITIEAVDVIMGKTIGYRPKIVIKH
jgi:hypothetical protein